MKNTYKKILAFSSTWTGAIIIVLVVIIFFGQTFIIPSRSMVGTFYEGDMVFVKKFSYGIPTPRIPWIELKILPDFNGNGHLVEGERPKRGDVVVFTPPMDDKTYFVKRVFAVGGDEVIFAKDGYYLHAGERTQELFPDSEIKEFFGKKFAHEPFMGEFAGIHYNEIFWHKDELNTRALARTQYFFDKTNGKFYHKACAAGSLKFSEADNTTTCDLLERVYSDLDSENFVPCENLSFEEMEFGFLATKMSKVTLESGEIVFYKKIPTDEFFMAGDNRNNSSDSRFWGLVPYENIIGQPWFVFFSFSKENSAEMMGDLDKKNRYVIRWERIFKGIDGLNELAKKEPKIYF